MRIVRNSKPALGIIGKIKVGELVERNGTTFPSSLDYFRATSDMQQYVEIFNRLHPKKNVIPVVFGVDNDDFNINHRYEIRDHAGNVYSYGEGVNYFVSQKEGFKEFDNAFLIEKYGSVEVFLNRVEQFLTKGRYKAEWKEVLTLRVIIPNIPIFGAWELRTAAAKSSIDQILNNYDIAKEINGGSIRSVPFFLRVKKVKSNRVLDRQRMYPVISLDQLLTESARGCDLLSGGSELKMLGE